MFAALTRFFAPAPEKQQAYIVYNTLVEQARRPIFYLNAQVPDTLDGRFELILLHLFMVLHRLQNEHEAEIFRQELIEAFFEDMDRSTRELGVSDTGVGKRVKRMADAFYGRIKAYEEALGETEKLTNALKRNVYGTMETVSDHAVRQMVIYIGESVNILKNHPVDVMVNCQFQFAEVQKILILE